MNGGNHHDRHVGVFFFGAFEQADAVEVGHHEVGEHQLESFVGVEHAERFHAGAGLLAGVAGRGEHGGDDFADGLFVIDNQNAVRHESPR